MAEFEVLNPDSTDASTIFRDAAGNIFRASNPAIVRALEMIPGFFLFDHFDENYVHLRKAAFHTNASVWSSAQMAEYLRFSLELREAMHREGLYISDGHPWNYIFEHTALKFIDFGSIRAGVQLSAAQIAEVNNAAGTNAAGPLQQLGWYLQILPASTPTRQNRGPWNITFWYLDRGSVQSLNLSSLAVL